MLTKDVIKLTGISKKGLEYYESKQLLKPARTTSNYRDYSTRDIQTIKKIMLLRNLNFTTEEIALIFNQPTSDIFNQKRTQLEREIYNQQTNLLYLNQCAELFNDTNESLLEELSNNIKEDRLVKDEWIKPRLWQRYHIGGIIIAFGIAILLTKYFPITNSDIPFLIIFIGLFFVSDRMYFNIYLLYQEIKQKFLK